MATTHMTRVDSARRRATVRRILGAGAVALMVSTLLTGTSSAETFTETNPTPIVLPRPAPPSGCFTGGACPVDQAVPYPSEITFNGLEGSVTDVNVTLNDLTYGRVDETGAVESGPGDLDIMLVAPNGVNTMLMSDACGNGDFNRIVDPIDLTFDDEAAATLPADAPCSTGTFKPVDDDDDGMELPPSRPADMFNPPAPSTSSTAALSTFDGIDPNGTWKLYVVDDGPNDEGGTDGEIAGGWTLQVEESGGVPPVDTTTSTTTGATTTSTTAGATTTSTTAATTTTTVAGGTTTTVAGGTTTTIPVAGPTLALSKTTVAPGDTVVVTGNGLPPNTPLQLNFLSHPVALGAVTTNAAGSFQTTVTIPSDATAGPHQINATNSAGTVLAAANLTVVRAVAVPRTLARTGYGVQAMVVLATGLILLGYLFFTSASAPAFTSRRRRHRW